MAGEQEVIEAPPMSILDDEEDAGGAPAPEPASERLSSDQPPSDQPRDEAGRYAEKPKDQPTGDQVAEPSPTAPPQDRPEGTEESGDETQDSEPGPAASYTADGVAYELAGSEVFEDGVFFPSKTWEDVQGLISSGRHHQTVWRQEQAESRQREQVAIAQANAQVQRANMLTAQLHTLLTKPDDEFYASALELRARWPEIRASAEQAAAQAQAQADRQQLLMYQARDQVAALLPQLQTDLADRIAVARDDARFKDLSDEDLVGAFQSLWANRNRVFVQHEGNWFTDQSVIDGQLALAMAQRRTAAQTEAAQQHNAAVVGAGTEPPAAPPPTTRTKGAPAPAGKVQFAGSGADKLDPEDQAAAVDAWFEEQDFE